jgi:hypothetical protein
MSNKSLKKEYELGHSYDFDEYNSPKQKKFIKRNSHRRVRRRFNKMTTKEKLTNDNA